MSDDDFNSAFEEKSNRLVWILPSIIIHIVGVLIWMSLPEEPPREPASRKMVIKSEQAEKLQQLVEDTNLKQLHVELSELQSIKAAMAKIREQKMAQLKAFEQEMASQAPMDAASLLNDIASIFNDIEKDFLAIEDVLKKEPPVYQKAKELIDHENYTEGIKAAVNLKTLRDQTIGKLDTINDNIGKLFALFSNGEMNLDWISNAQVAETFNQLKIDVNEINELNQKLKSDIYSKHNRKSRDFNSYVYEKPDDVIAFIVNFKHNAIEGQQKIEKARTELKQEIEKTEALIQTNSENKNKETESLKKENELLSKAKALKPINDEDKSNQKKLITAASDNISSIKTAMSTVSDELRKLQQTLKQQKNDLANVKDYSPSKDDSRRMGDLKNGLASLFDGLPDISNLTSAIDKTRSAKANSQTIYKKLTSLAPASDQAHLEGGQP